MTSCCVRITRISEAEVAREDPQTTKTGGLLPGEVPGRGPEEQLRTIKAYKENILRAVRSKNTKGLSSSMIQASNEWAAAQEEMQRARHGTGEIEASGAKWAAARDKWKTAFYGNAYVANPDAYNAVEKIISTPESAEIPAAAAAEMAVSTSVPLLGGIKSVGRTGLVPFASAGVDTV